MKVFDGGQQELLIVAGCGAQPHSDATMDAANASRRNRLQGGVTDEVVSDPERTSVLHDQPAVLEGGRSILDTGHRPPVDVSDVLGKQRTRS